MLRSRTAEKRNGGCPDSRGVLVDSALLIALPPSPRSTLAPNPTADQEADRVFFNRLVVMARTIATTTTVDRFQLFEFIRPRHHAVLSTIRADGTPQMSPITLGVDDHGHLVISTYPHRAKVANIRRNPAVSVCILSDDFGSEWVQVDGTGEVLDLPEALEPLVEYYRNISGEHPNWDEYRQAMADQGKVLIRIEIGRWGPIARGGFPPELADE